MGILLSTGHYEHWGLRLTAPWLFILNVYGYMKARVVVRLD